MWYKKGCTLTAHFMILVPLSTKIAKYRGGRVCNYREVKC